MEIIQNITIDLFARDILPEVIVNQGDNAVTVKARLQHGNISFIPGGDAKVYVRKPDGTLVYNGCSIEGDFILVKTTTQMTAASGDALVVLQMTEGDTVLKTPVFRMRVLKTIADDEAVESSDEFGALESALQDVEKIKKEGVIKGDPGTAATITIGSVFTGKPGSAASVTNGGTEYAAVLDFVIPQGAQGPEGPAGSLDTDGTVEYQEPEVYTAPVSGISLKTWLGRAAKGLSDLFEGLAEKLDNANGLKSYDEVMAATAEGFYPDALAVKTGFTQLNTNLGSKVPTEKGVGGTLFKCTGGNLAMFYFDSGGNISIRFGDSSSGYTYVGIRPDGIYCNNVKKVTFS